jgi:density-regulated protein
MPPEVTLTHSCEPQSRHESSVNSTNEHRSTANSAAQPRNARNGFTKTTRTCTRIYTLRVRLLEAALSGEANVTTEAIKAGLAALSVEAQKRAEKDAAKKSAKAAASEQREAERKADAMVYIKRVERQKRKYVTVVTGLEEHGLDLKKMAKEFGKKFATGSSVTKTASGTEEITVQGDVSDDLYDFLEEKYGDVIPEDNVECIEDKKNKKAAG